MGSAPRVLAGTSVGVFPPFRPRLSRMCVRLILSASVPGSCRRLCRDPVGVCSGILAASMMARDGGVDDGGRAFFCRKAAGGLFFCRKAAGGLFFCHRRASRMVCGVAGFRDGVWCGGGSGVGVRSFPPPKNPRQSPADKGIRAQHITYIMLNFHHSALLQLLSRSCPAWIYFVPLER